MRQFVMVEQPQSARAKETRREITGKWGRLVRCLSSFQRSLFSGMLVSLMRIPISSGGKPGVTLLTSEILFSMHILLMGFQSLLSLGGKLAIRDSTSKLILEMSLSMMSHFSF